MRRCSQTRRAMMRRRSPPMPAPRRRTTPSACRRTCSNDPRTPASGSPRRADHPNTTYRGNSMQLSMQLSYSGGFQESADQVVAYEQAGLRSEEHTSELQSLMRISYAVFCLKKKKYTKRQNNDTKRNNT